MADASYARRKEQTRGVRNARAHTNLRRGIDLRAVAPGHARGDGRGTRFLLWFVAAIAGHVSVAYAALSMPRGAHSVSERVTVRVVHPSKPEPPQSEPLVPTLPPELPPPAPPPAAKRPRARRERPVEAVPPSAPVTPAAPAAPPRAPAEGAPPPPAVGLSLDATSSTSGGPAFAVGQTLEGSTDAVASAPRAPAPLPAAPALSTPAPVAPVSRNRRATPRPAAGVRVEPARRLAHVEPVYPALLKRQGLEADVTVRVSLDAKGQVSTVELVRGAREPEFDRAALDAARRERFSPQAHDGVPVSTSLTYTYRFRIGS